MNKSLVYNNSMKMKILLLFIFFLILFFCYKFFSIRGLQESRRVDGIVEPIYTQDCFPRTLQLNGVTKKCFEYANLGQKAFCKKSELKMIEEYYKEGQDKDPLNNGSGQFCADEK